MKSVLIIILLLTSHLALTQSLYDTIVKIPHTTVKDQQMSSTCWSFATTSFIESELIRKGQINPDLSEMFFAYHALKAKTEMHIRMEGNNFFTPGGQMHDVMNIIRDHGLMPESAFSGFTTRTYGHNHSLLDTALSRYMREISALKYPALPERWPLVVDSILSANLGTPPPTFPSENKQWTPHQYRDSLPFNPDDYITITSYSHHPYYSWFVLEDRFNWAMEQYFNVPPGVFEMICDSALLKGYSFAWDGDVSEKTFNAEAGTAVISPDEKADMISLRQKMFDSHETTVDHVMHVVGKLKKYNGETYYLVKNSWGKYGKNNGYILMNRSYFILKTVAVMVNKEALPAEVKDKIAR